MYQNGAQKKTRYQSLVPGERDMRDMLKKRRERGVSLTQRASARGEPMCRTCANEKAKSSDFKNIKKEYGVMGVGIKSKNVNL